MLKFFWQELFVCHSPIEIRKNLFNEYDETNDRALCQAINYLSEENYQYIRENRNKINFAFKNIDIRNLNEELTENCDFITLSNIILYAHYMYKENHLEEFKNLIELLSQRVNKGGNIVVGYLYDIENENDARDIYSQKIRDSIFYETEYSYFYFQKIMIYTVIERLTTMIHV